MNEKGNAGEQEERIERIKRALREGDESEIPDDVSVLLGGEIIADEGMIGRIDPTNVGDLL